MTRRLRHAVMVGVVVVVALTGLSNSVRAQTLAVPVFDASNYAEDLVQVFDLAEEVATLVVQTQPIPVNMATRYQVLSPFWALNTLVSAVASAGPVVGALNAGDPTGASYRQVVDPLDTPTDVLARMPLALQRRFADDYATIQLADSVASLGIDQSGTARRLSAPFLEVLQSMQADAFTTDARFQTETALLNKINSTSVVGLQVGEQTNEFLSSVLEALVVDGKRQRDTEAKVMNASINQWRYGTAYSGDLFSRTAGDLDAWWLR
jgi:hypothetical protein